MSYKPVITLLADRIYRKPHILVPPGWGLMYNKTRDIPSEFEHDILLVMDENPSERLEAFYKSNEKVLDSNVIYIKTNKAGYPDKGERRRFIKRWVELIKTLPIKMYAPDVTQEILGHIDGDVNAYISACRDILWWSGADDIDLSRMVDDTNYGNTLHKIYTYHGEEVTVIRNVHNNICYVAGFYYLISDPDAVTYRPFSEDKKLQLFIVEPTAVYNMIPNNLLLPDDWVPGGGY